MDDVTESKEAKVEIRVYKYIWMMYIFDWIEQKKTRFLYEKKMNNSIKYAKFIVCLPSSYMDVNKDFTKFL